MSWLLHGVGLWVMVGFALAGWVFAGLAVAHLLSDKWYPKPPPHYPDDCDVCRWNSDKIEG